MRKEKIERKEKVGPENNARYRDKTGTEKKKKAQENWKERKKERNKEKKEREREREREKKKRKKQKKKGKTKNNKRKSNKERTKKRKQRKKTKKGKRKKKQQRKGAETNCRWGGGRLCEHNLLQNSKRSEMRSRARSSRRRNGNSANPARVPCVRRRVHINTKP